jgi:hypothetical protein
MPKNKLVRVIALFSIASFIVLSLIATPASALISQNANSWFTNSDTSAAAVAVGDVNNDGLSEIVTGGWFSDGLRWNAQLVIWNSATLAPIASTSWYWVNDTQVTSVAIGDVNGDGKTEIVAGGSYFDGTRWIAQLSVWNGTNLAFLYSTAWFWTNNTQISSVAVANITGTRGLNVVTGGSYFDGNRTIAQLCIWNGTNLAFQNAKVWYWTNNTYINSVAVANMTGTTSLTIVTGGAFLDGLRYNSQLVLWNATDLSFQNVVTWYWTGDTEINSIAVANVTGGTAQTIVTGGSYFDGTRTVAQLVEWNGSSLALQGVTTWYWFSNTKINSVVVGNYTGGATLDIITGGVYNDLTRNNAQIVNWNGANLAVKSLSSWWWTSDTTCNAVAIGNVPSFGNRVIAGGSFFDLTRSNSQLSIWT